MTVLLTIYLSSDRIKKNEMGVAYSTYGVGDRCIQDFGGDVRERTTLKT
jgi:hypothetical protein